MLLERARAENRLILICGYDKSGKTEAACFLERHGFYIFECGAYIRSKYGFERGVKLSNFYSENLDNLDIEIAKSIFDISNNRVVGRAGIAVVGVRSHGLFRLLKSLENLNKFSVFIESNFDLRYSRYCIARESRFLMSRDEFSKNDHLQRMWGIEKVRENCDIVIDNNSEAEIFLLVLKERLGLNEKFQDDGHKRPEFWGGA